MTPADKNQHPASAHAVYLALIGIVFLGLTVIFLFFPRTQYSELEKRELAQFPDFGNYDLSNITQLPNDISFWFSDSEPFRDEIMNFSMNLRDKIRLEHGNPEDQISFKPTAQSSGADDATADNDMGGDLDEMLEAAGNPLAEANATVQNSGTIVVGTGENVRALMAFGASPKMGQSFVDMATQYADAFPNVKVYALLPPSSSEFYLPEKGASLSKPQKPVLDYIADNLPSNVKFVEVYPYLAAHTYDDIYLRTDHHWAPLGAFYGAKAFAKAANVPFKGLDSYDEHVIKRYVGSMYGYTKDIAVKNAPEDFVYYVPKGLDYTTTYIMYTTNSEGKVSSASKPYQGEFFHKFKDGSGNAYLTFMGGDQYLVKVNTGTPSNRKLLIIKDSFGNPVPGYLFYSFGEVHVADFRYFPQNMKTYVAENGITDILFVFNIFNAVGTRSMSRVAKLLTQDGGLAPATPASKPAQEKQEDNSQSEPVKAPAAESSEPAPAPQEESSEPTD